MTLCSFFGRCRCGVQISKLRIQDMYCLVCMLALRLDFRCTCAENGLVTPFFYNFVIPFIARALFRSSKFLLNQSVGRPFPIHIEC